MIKTVLRYLFPTPTTLKFVRRASVECFGWNPLDKVVRLGGLCIFRGYRRLGSRYDNEVPTTWSKSYLHNLNQYFLKYPVQRWWAYRLAKVDEE